MVRQRDVLFFGEEGTLSERGGHTEQPHSSGTLKSGWMRAAGRPLGIPWRYSVLLPRPQMATKTGCPRNAEVGFVAYLRTTLA